MLPKNWYDPRIIEKMAEVARKNYVEALMYIHKRRIQEGCQFTEIFLGTGKNPGIVSRALRYLQKEGLVEKTDNQRYRVTEKGQKIAEALDILYNTVREEYGYE